MGLALGVLLGCLLAVLLPYVCQRLYLRKEYRREMRKLERWYQSQLVRIKQDGDFYEAAFARAARGDKR